MTPNEIIRAEYGHSRNIMTPDTLDIGALPEGAYELSTGFGLENEPIYGVSVVYVTPDGTRRNIKDSKLFHSLDDAHEHIQKLRTESRS